MTYWPAEVAHRAPVNDFPPAWASAWGDDRYGLWADLVVGGVTQRMRWIEPTVGNEFWMGSSQRERDSIKDEEIRKWANQNESMLSLVHFEDGFWLSDTPCTQSLWTAVTGHTSPELNVNARQGLHPVIGISYYDARNFLDQLKSVTPSIGIATFPTEQQWEYACRADTQTAFWWGDTFKHQMANVSKNAKGAKAKNITTTPVKHYPPNPWGLYDMHGNVGEWCDKPWWIFPDPEGPAAQMQIGQVATVRGGSWMFPASRARAAFRYIADLNQSGTTQGFRFVLSSANT